MAERGSTATTSCTPAFAGRCRRASTSPRSAARAGRARRPTRSRSATSTRTARGATSATPSSTAPPTAWPRRLRRSASSAATGWRSSCRSASRPRWRTSRCYRLGAVAMPLSMLFGPDALEYRINDSGAAPRDRRRERHRQRARRRGRSARGCATWSRSAPRAGQGDVDWRGAARRAPATRSTPVDDRAPTTPRC